MAERSCLTCKWLSDVDIVRRDPDGKYPEEVSRHCLYQVKYPSCTYGRGALRADVNMEHPYTDCPCYESREERYG